MAATLKVIPLGGMGEIGKNLTVLEYGNDIVVIDCGLTFPDEEMLGIDLVIPDMTYLEKNAERLRGFLITHGHEDHIGALPFALKKFNVPVYGTRLTIGLIKHKLEENDVKEAELISVSPGDTIRLGCFSVEFIKTSHSIAGAVALAINTPVGTIIHTGDFKVDYTPIDGEPIDIARIAGYGSKGVLLLMSDSTNVERPGTTQSEREIGKTFEHYFDMAKGRVIVSSFASNIYRIQQIADVAVSFGRIICFQGRSMLNIAKMARDMGYLNIPDEKIVDVEKLKFYDDDKVCVITTGSQGEPMSGLYRMANSTHKLNIGKGDMVIISATAIPGNEKGVARVINQLFQKGAMVVYDSMADVHVSGHACREELRLMFTITKPKYFIPVHGEYRHLYQHARLAEEMGVKPENIFVAETGNVIEFTKKDAKINGTVQSGSIMVDGLGIGDIGNAVLRDRRLLSQDGLFAVIIALEKHTGKLLAEPEILSRGFVYVRDSDELMNEAVELIREQAHKFENSQKSEWASHKNNIKSTLKTYLYNKTKRTPMILPIIVEV
ncbi:MAG: Ribonuclease J 1 [Firmicutes bacterium ADurb.Bin182]|nr:MAG: Ribonuclease J 1 [Firmicutes bacterium ADurb.Bin182]